MNLTDLYLLQVAETGTVSSAALLLNFKINCQSPHPTAGGCFRVNSSTAPHHHLIHQGLHCTRPSPEGVDGRARRAPHANAELSGPLRLTTTPGFGQSSILIDTLMNFGQRYPKVTLELSLTNRVVNLVEEGFDVGIRLFQGTIPGGANTQTRMLTNFTFGLYASPNYVTHHPVANETYDYRKHPYIGMTLLNLLDRKWINENAAAADSACHAKVDLKHFCGETVGHARRRTRHPETFIAEPLVAQGQLVHAPELKLNAGKAALVCPRAVTSSHPFGHSSSSPAWNGWRNLTKQANGAHAFSSFHF